MITLLITIDILLTNVNHNYHLITETSSLFRSQALLENVQHQTL